MTLRSLTRTALSLTLLSLVLLNLSCGPSAEQLKQQEEREIALAHENSEKLFRPYFEEFLRPYREFSDQETKLLNKRSDRALAELAKIQDEQKNPYIAGKIIFISVHASEGFDLDYDQHNDDTRLNQKELIARQVDEVGTVVYIWHTVNKGPAIRNLNGGQAGYLTSTSYAIWIIDRKAGKVIGNKTFDGEMPEGNSDGTFTFSKTSGKPPDIVPYILALPRR